MRDNGSRRSRGAGTDLQILDSTRDLRRHLRFLGDVRRTLQPSLLLRTRWRLMIRAGRLWSARKIGKVSEDI